MEDLTFGEQVKIVLSRKDMTIKELAESIEGYTGKRMSRQNLTQRLARDNFQERDMRMIAAILGCPFTLDILTGVEHKAMTPRIPSPDPVLSSGDASSEDQLTIGEMYELHKHKHLADDEDEDEVLDPEFEEDLDENEDLESGPVLQPDDDEDLEKGEMNPYTGHEYKSNSVRMHPSRIGYVQVYDRKDHKWTDMTEWAFLGYQERQKVTLGRAYKPPIYLD